uniref:C2H2-type domain-containing protein n=1 Tax=Eptatretus burgeri TaxID=7764 RepID=A0A8C4Q9Z3_EPTBU
MLLGMFSKPPIIALIDVDYFSLHIGLRNVYFAFLVLEIRVVGFSSIYQKLFVSHKFPSAGSGEPKFEDYDSPIDQYSPNGNEEDEEPINLKIERSSVIYSRAGRPVKFPNRFHGDCITQVDLQQRPENHLFTSEENHEYSHCSDSSANNQVIKSYIGIHTRDKLHKCATCGKAFSRFNHLEKHMRIHTGERPYMCTECGNTFSQSIHLKTHMRIHTGERPHICPACGKSFAISSSLRRHLKMHLKKFAQARTGYVETFSESLMLEEYLKTRTRRKSNKCMDCGKEFTQFSFLETHIRIHTGERPYKCVTCGAAFSQLPHLKRHMKIHTGEKPFKCPACEKSFTQSGNLKKHMEIHTRVGNFLNTSSIVVNNITINNDGVSEVDNSCTIKDEVKQDEKKEIS